MNRGLLIIIMISVLCATHVSSSTLVRLGSVLDHLPEGKVLRFADDSGQMIEGEYAGRQDDSAFVTVDGRATGIELSRVQAMWIRSSAIRTGAITGAILLGLGGMAAGAVAAGLSEGEGGGSVSEVTRARERSL